MGYYVRKLRRKRKPPGWKLQFISYRQEDTKASVAAKPKKEWDVPPERWRRLGFTPEMSLVDARARGRQVNGELRRKHASERRCEFELAQREFGRRTAEAFPPAFVAEFEARYLRRPMASTSHRRTQRSGWNTVRRVIAAVEPDPSKWYDATKSFYDYFARRGWSMSYVRRLLQLANLWGFFVSRKTGRPFLAVAAPRGYERARLYDAHYRKVGRRSCKSEPLTPEALDAARPGLCPKHYNWLYLSVWAGLRPQEIDQLKDPALFMVKSLPDGNSVLWVYQTKIVALPPWERWKPIPLIFPEQRCIPEIIRNRLFRRPSVKIVRPRFGDCVSLYGGRKGFTDLMLSRRQPLEFVAQWMGHTTIERTWRWYKHRGRFHYDAPLPIAS